MRTYIILIFYFIFISSFGQTIKILDIESKEAIPYVTIVNGNNKFYSNENGEFDINKLEQDSIYLEHWLHKPVGFTKKEIPLTVYMEPTAVNLEQVIITAKTTKQKKIKANKKEWAAPQFTKYEYITFIKPNKGITDELIKEIKFNHSVTSSRKFSKEEVIPLFRLNFYSGFPFNQENLIYSSETIKTEPKNPFLFGSKNSLNYKITGVDIPLKEKGIAIGIEFLGYFKNEMLLSDEKSLINVPLSSKQNKNYSSKTYVKYIKDNKFYVDSIENLIPTTNNTHNMLLDLVITKRK